MTPTQITATARLIRPLLCGQLSLIRAVYPPCDPQWELASKPIVAAIQAFDELTAWAMEQAASDLTDHLDDDDDLNMPGVHGTRVAGPNDPDDIGDDKNRDSPWE